MVFGSPACSPPPQPPGSFTGVSSSWGSRSSPPSSRGARTARASRERDPVPYRVRGYPYLQTERPQGTAAELDAGKIDLADVQPALLAALERVGEQLRRPLSIFSGYRTSAYSEKVGGFAGDPHSRGIAADLNINGTPVGSFPRARRLLTAQGLISGAQAGFYRGRSDPAHVQLSASSGSSSSSSRVNLEQLWIQAGGSPAWARIMAAVALAESGGNLTAHNATPPDDSYGLWQINYYGDLRAERTRQFGPPEGLYDPLANARAAVRIKGSGLPTDWSTYTSGAYRQYLQRAPGATVPSAAP